MKFKSGGFAGCPRNCVATPYENPTTCISNGTQTPCRVELFGVLYRNAENLDQADALDQAREVLLQALEINDQQPAVWTLLTSVYVGLNRLRAAHTSHTVAFMLGGRPKEDEHMGLCEQFAGAGNDYLYLARDCYLVVATSLVTTPSLAVQASALSRELSYKLQVKNRPEFDAPPPPLLTDSTCQGGSMCVAVHQDPSNGVSMLPTLHKGSVLAQYHVRERAVLHVHVSRVFLCHPSLPVRYALYRYAVFCRESCVCIVVTSPCKIRLPMFAVSHRGGCVCIDTPP